MRNWVNTERFSSNFWHSQPLKSTSLRMLQPTHRSSWQQQRCPLISTSWIRLLNTALPMAGKGSCTPADFHTLCVRQLHWVNNAAATLLYQKCIPLTTNKQMSQSINKTETTDSCICVSDINSYHLKAPPTLPNNVLCNNFPASSTTIVLNLSLRYFRL